MLPPQAMVMQVPMGIPPPAPMLMVQQQSQNLLGNQPLPMVGGVPSIVPRSIPPVTTALSNLKNAGQTENVLPLSVVPSTTAGDATPTEEEGTNVSSPSVQMSIPCTVSGPAGSTQPVVSMAQFNQLLGLNSSRPMLPVPPPVSTAGTPIPYPPPHMGFNFPPPGIRHPGQGMPPNPQFPWMQKQAGSPFTDADSSQSTTSNSVRPVPPPQSGMPAHMFGNRPPFHDSQSSVSHTNSSPMKEPHKGRDKVEQKLGEIDSSCNRNVSDNHQDKMIQEMVISTDDESSMDIEYSRSDIPAGPCFQGLPDFPRAPMNMQRMRGPLGSMPPGPGPRFRGMPPLGSPFPMRMGGPRMGGPGMHNRMDMEYSPHHGSRGPRIPMGPHGSHRNDMHPQHDGRDWYPRDFDGPPYDRERDRHYRDDWGREPWDAEGDSRRSSREYDDGRRDDPRDSWNRDHSDMSRPSRDSGVTNDKGDSSRRQKERSNKSKSSKNLLDDLLKFQSGGRGSSQPLSKSSRNEQNKDKPIRKEDSNEAQKSDSNVEQTNNGKDSGNVQSVPSKRERDRENRKRSRWGRTLSEEREIQEQRRYEVELKFQSYEQSHVAQQPSQTALKIPAQNSDQASKDQSVQDLIASEAESAMAAVPETDSVMPPAPTVDSVMPTLPETSSVKPIVPENSSGIPIATDCSSVMPIATETNLGMPIVPVTSSVTPIVPETSSVMSVVTEVSSVKPTIPEPSSDILTCNTIDMPVQNEVHMHVETPIDRPFQSVEVTKANAYETLVPNSSELNELADSKVPTDLCTDIPRSDSFNSCNIIGNAHTETGVIESSDASVCNESVNNVSTDTHLVDSAITNSTSSENSVVTDNAITNNSLVSTES